MLKKNTCKQTFFLLFALAMILLATSCTKDSTGDDVSNSGNGIETRNIPSINLKEDYNAWFQLQGKYIESFGLTVAEVRITSDKGYYQKTDKLTAALVENVTDKKRGGFFVMGDTYFSLNALDEIIMTLENIAIQIKNDKRIYNCQRLYNTFCDVTITFQYSSSENNWNYVEIYYSSEKSPRRIESEYLVGYINGLKECKQTIVDYTEGKWNN